MAPARRAEALLAAHGLQTRFHGACRITGPGYAGSGQTGGGASLRRHRSLACRWPVCPICQWPAPICAWPVAIIWWRGRWACATAWDMQSTGQIRQDRHPRHSRPAGCRRTGDAVHPGYSTQRRDFLTRRWKKSPPRRLRWKAKIDFSHRHARIMDQHGELLRQLTASEAEQFCKSTPTSTATRRCICRRPSAPPVVKRAHLISHRAPRAADRAVHPRWHRFDDFARAAAARSHH